MTCKPVSDDNAIEQKWKLFLARHEYAWRYFELHAKQRTTMFNFFMVFAALVLNAYASLLKENEFFVSAVVGGLGALISVFFVFLERRNEELVNVAESVLVVLEDDVLFPPGFCSNIDYPKRRGWFGRMDETSRHIQRGIISRQTRDKNSDIHETKYSHGTWLPRIQFTIILVFIFLSAYSVGMLCCHSPSNCLS